MLSPKIGTKKAGMQFCISLASKPELEMNSDAQFGYKNRAWWMISNIDPENLQHSKEEFKINERYLVAITR